MTQPGSNLGMSNYAASEVGRLLIVDDNVDYLKTLELLLDDTGYTCRFCADGTSAIEAARNEEFDVLLTDVRMVPVDGVETARTIKLLQPLIAIVMMTGFDREDTPLEALRLGAVDYIDKPITDANAFLRLLDRQVQLVHRAKQLRATKERLEAVLEHIDTGVIVLNAEGIVEDMNPAAQAVVAPHESEVLGAVFRDICRIPELLLPVPHAETVSTSFERVIEGRKRLLQVDMTPLTGLSHRWAGTVLLIKDLTAVAESQKAEGWRQVSRAITHGMKTPLGTLRMRLERLIRLATEGPIHDEADLLLRVVGELHARLRDMVDFVKLDLAMSPGDVNAVVSRAVRRFEMHRGANTKIEFHAGENLPDVQLSASGLELAIENLLANSQEAATDAVEIVVSTRRDEERPGVLVAVEDNGRGISPEVRDEVFRRPLNSTKPGGSGLGAALVKYIVEQHHRALTWQSPLLPGGGGTRVTLRLPAHDTVMGHQA